MKKAIRRILAAGVLAILFTTTGCYYMGPCISGSGPVQTEIREITGFTGVINTGSFDVYVNEADDFEVEVVAQENLLPIIETYVSGGSLIIELKKNTCLRSGSPVEVHVSLPELDQLRLAGSGRLSADVVDSPEVEISNSGSGWMGIDSIFASSALLSNSGSGRIEMDAVYAEEAALVQSGSGAILGGSLFGVADLRIRHSSSGRVMAAVIGATMVDIILSGSGRVELEGDAVVGEYSLNSSGRVDALNLEVPEIDATVTGSGDIFLWATEVLDATITGSGHIIYRGNPQVSINISGSGSVRPY